MSKNPKVRVLSLVLALSFAATSLAACGDSGDAAGALALNKNDKSEKNGADSKPSIGSEEKDKDAKDKDSSDELSPEEMYPEEDVDEEWMEVLEANGTFYDAFYNLRKIMKEEEPNHPDNVKMPKGIIRDNNDYYIPDMEVPETTSADMSEITGRWIPVSSTYMDTETDWTWAREANVDFHLDLNDDGTCSCNMFGGEQKGSWDARSIPIAGKDCAYGMEGDILVLHNDMGLGAEMVYRFERDTKGNTLMRAHEDDESEYLGHKLPGAKLYRLKDVYQGGAKKEYSDSDPDLDPKTHFVVLAETDDEYHSGYGYMRNGVTDTMLYYQCDRGIVKLINEDTTDRGRNMGRTRFEITDDDKLVRIWPGSMSDAGDYSEYELCEDEQPPRSHLAAGPVPSRDEIEVPEGSHEKAGFYRLDKIFNYTFVAGDPLMENPYQAGTDDNVYGTDTRKYDADFWYVLKEDGTGYMRAWNRYFEVVWSDDVQYYYDISGKHQLSIVVGEIDYDGTFMRMFKDELNPVPEYPEELTFEGAKKLKEEIEKKREERAKNKDED